MRPGNFVGGLVLLLANVGLLLAVRGYGPVVVNRHALATLGLFNCEVLLISFVVVGAVSMAAGLRRGDGAASTGLKMDVLRHLSVGTQPHDITRITGMTEEDVEQQLEELRKQGHTTRRITLRRRGTMR